MYKLQKFYPKGFNSRAYWEDKYAKEHIAGKKSEEFREQGFWPALQQLLVKEGRYLDAGCGIGGWILFLREEGFQVEGIDTSRQALQALTEYDRDVQVRLASIDHIPDSSGVFDGVLAIGTLEYMEDMVEVSLQEVHRVLQPGGFIFIEVPLKNWLRRLLYLPLKRLQYSIRTWQGDVPTFANYLFTPAEICQALEVAGFRVELVVPHELPEATGHYGLYVDWLLLRGAEPYTLNTAGQLIKKVCNAVSPWIASTGMVIVARKK